MRFAGKPERFAKGLEQVLGATGPYTRHAVGWDARMLCAANRLMPSRVMHQVTRLAMGIPRKGRRRHRVSTPVPFDAYRTVTT